MGFNFWHDKRTQLNRAETPNHNICLTVVGSAWSILPQSPVTQARPIERGFIVRITQNRWPSRARRSNLEQTGGKCQRPQFKRVCIMFEVLAEECGRMNCIPMGVKHPNISRVVLTTFLQVGVRRFVRNTSPPATKTRTRCVPRRRIHDNIRSCQWQHRRSPSMQYNTP